jgi:hypothetical protein
VPKPAARSHYVRWDDAERDRLARWWRDGLTASSIANRLGVSEGWVTKRAAEIGLPRRDGQERKPRPRAHPDRHHPAVSELEDALDRMVREAVRRGLPLGRRERERAVEAALVMVRGRRRGA